MNLKMILATDECGGLGAGNDLLVYSKEDLKHFKEETEDGVVIMGRNTWLSLPENSRPLPNRLNIVLTHDKNESLVNESNGLGADMVVHSTAELEHLIHGLESVYPDNIYLIGGASLYNHYYDKCSEIIHTTYVDRVYSQADVFFEHHGEMLNDFEVKDSKELHCKKNNMKLRVNYLRRRK